MYYSLILCSVSLIIVLSYFGFRYLEVKIEHQLKSDFLAVFYGYAGMVYALAAVLVSWMWLYALNVFIGLPCLIVAYLCAQRSQVLSQNLGMRRVVISLMGAALFVAMIGLFFFLNP